MILTDIICYLDIFHLSLTDIFVHRYESITLQLDIWKNKQKNMYLKDRRYRKLSVFPDIIHGKLGQINTLVKNSLISITLNFSTAGNGQLQRLT